MLYFDKIKEKHGHDIANIVAGSLEELQTDGLNITSHILELAITHYHNNSDLIGSMSLLSEKRRYITQFIREAR